MLEDAGDPAGRREQVRKVDVRIVAATNRDLQAMAADGRFREDLFFRLSAFHITVPPLRERREDMPSLIRYLLRRGASRLGLAQGPLPDAEAEDILLNHDWPGNVRELENVLQRAMILTDSGRITVADLPPQLTPAVPANATAVDAPAAGDEPLRDQVRRFEHARIMRAIDDCGGDRRAAAQRLGIGLSSLYRKLEEFGTTDSTATP